MSIVSIILIALLVILLFRVGFAILRFIISAALILLGLYWDIKAYFGLWKISKYYQPIFNKLLN